MRSLLDAVDFIAATERELGLVDRSFYGAPIWPYLRMVLFTLLLTKVGAYSSTGAFRPEPAHATYAVRQWVRYNPYLRVGKRQFVVIGSPVVYQLGDRKIDIYTDDLVRALPPGESEIIRLEGGSTDPASHPTTTTLSSGITSTSGVSCRVGSMRGRPKGKIAT